MVFIGLLVVCLILAVIGFKLRVEREKNEKLFKIVSWVIVIGFAVKHFISLLYFLDYIDFELFKSDESILEMLDFRFVILEVVILLIINVVSISNKPKAVFLTITQTATSVVLVICVIIMIAGLFAGASGGNKATSKRYTSEEDRYAKANGYFDAQSANEKGFDTSQANNPGFDYTQKRD